MLPAAIGEGIAAQKFTADYFRTGGAIKGTLETEQALGDDDYERFMAHWQATAANGSTPLLEYGFKYKAINLSPEASQLIQAKVFSIDDIARKRGVSKTTVSRAISGKGRISSATRSSLLIPPIGYAIPMTS